MDPDGDLAGAYAVPACPRAWDAVPVRGSRRARDQPSVLQSAGATSALHEAESMALRTFSRSTPPDGDLEAATQAASTNQNPIDLRNGWSHGEWNGWAAEDEDGAVRGHHFFPGGHMADRPTITTM